MTKKEIFVAYDVDVVAGWLVSYGGQDSPHDISRRALAGEVGIPRLLKLFRKYKLKTTWFIPRHSIESFREQVEEVVKDEKELGTHGYSHENPVRLSPEQEEEILVKSYKLIKEDQGIPPVGDTAPGGRCLRTQYLSS